METSEVTDTLPAGFVFGAYVIRGCIGQGGMARVYRAEHRALRKPVALKVMDGALLRRPDGRHRFLREGQAAAAVKHPNVVDINDVGVWQGRPYLVMELLEGEDLDRHLSVHKPLAETEVARLMIPVIAGLATAHACGVVHRDLKPSNVFLARGPDGGIVPKLLDFGISKLSSPFESLDPSSTPIGELMGSPMYMSPEAVRGARDLTAQSDQYSVGVVLYECITGRPPFEGNSLLSVLEAVVQGRFDPPRRHRPDLSASLEAVILRAMSPDPADRFENMRELGRALCQAADQRTRLLWTPSFGLPDELEGRTTAVLGALPLHTDSPLTASVHAAAARVGPGQRRRWWGAGLAALGGLGLIAFAFSRQLGSRREPAAGVLPSAATEVRALQLPVEPAVPGSGGLEAERGAVPAAAPGDLGDATGRESAEALPAPLVRRPARPRASKHANGASARVRLLREASPANRVPGVEASREVAVEQRPAPALPEAPPSGGNAPALPAAAPRLGANQAPILD